MVRREHSIKYRAGSKEDGRAFEPGILRSNFRYRSINPFRWRQPIPRNLRRLLGIL